jgi:uncharacterized small protein (DUF1192 family)
MPMFLRNKRVTFASFELGRRDTTDTIKERKPMDDLSLKRAKLAAELAIIAKQANLLGLQKGRDAHHMRRVNEAAARTAELREAIKTLDAEIAAKKASA